MSLRTEIISLTHVLLDLPVSRQRASAGHLYGRRPKQYTCEGLNHHMNKLLGLVNQIDSGATTPEDIRAMLQKARRGHELQWDEIPDHLLGFFAVRVVFVNTGLGLDPTDMANWQTFSDAYEALILAA